LFECASSTAIRPLECILPPEVFEEAMDFEREIETLEPLLFILRRFLEQISLRLEMAWLTAKELRLRLYFAGAGGQVYERLFQIPAPTRSVDILFRMLHTHLENFRAERPIIALHLSAAACHPASHQLGLFETALRDPHLFCETLARLGALLGNGRVGTPVAESTWRPDAFHMQPPGIEDSPALSAAPPAPPKGLALRRFRPPLPARVLLREEKPVFITTATFHGSIRDTRGPWRGSGNWWDITRWAGDEWDIQTETGELYRLSQQSEGWFVQGELG
jgi:protein ImuB